MIFILLLNLLLNLIYYIYCNFFLIIIIFYRRKWFWRASNLFYFLLIDTFIVVMLPPAVNIRTAILLVIGKLLSTQLCVHKMSIYHWVHNIHLPSSKYYISRRLRFTHCLRTNYVSRPLHFAYWTSMFLDGKILVSLSVRFLSFAKHRCKNLIFSRSRLTFFARVIRFWYDNLIRFWYMPQSRCIRIYFSRTYYSRISHKQDTSTGYSASPFTESRRIFLAHSPRRSLTRFSYSGA